MPKAKRPDPATCEHNRINVTFGEMVTGRDRAMVYCADCRIRLRYHHDEDNNIVYDGPYHANVD
jgi:hypothetical protein